MRRHFCHPRIYTRSVELCASATRQTLQEEREPDATRKSLSSSPLNWLASGTRIHLCHRRPSTVKIRVADLTPSDISARATFNVHSMRLRVESSFSRRHCWPFIPPSASPCLRVSTEFHAVVENEIFGAQWTSVRATLCLFL